MKVGIVSPHRDDAAFSCGATAIALLRAASTVTVVNIFTISDYTAPDYTAPDYTAPGHTAPGHTAPGHTTPGHTTPGATPSGNDRVYAVTLGRLQEDQTFVKAALAAASASAAQSGAQTPALTLHDLSWKDAPLRHALRVDQVLSSPLSAGTLQRDVEALAHDLTAVLQAFDLVLAPLALGDHIDHRIAREATRHVVRADRLAFYEDLPYAARVHPAQRHRATAGILQSIGEPAFHRYAVCMPDAAPLKVRLALCYPTQIAPVVAHEMAQFAMEAGSAERFFANERFAHIFGALLATGANLVLDSHA